MVLERPPASVSAPTGGKVFCKAPPSGRGFTLALRRTRILFEYLLTTRRTYGQRRRIVFARELARQRVADKDAGRFTRQSVAFRKARVFERRSSDIQRQPVRGSAAR